LQRIFGKSHALNGTSEDEFKERTVPLNFGREGETKREKQKFILGIGKRSKEG